MLLTDNPVYCRKAQLLRSHGMTTVAQERNKGAQFYDVVELGYNYRLDDIHAALGIAQLKKLPQDIRSRNRTAVLYGKRLGGVPGIGLPFSRYQGLSSYYIYPVLIEARDRNALKRALEKKGIQTSIHYPPVHLFKHFKPFKVALPYTEKISRCALSLPMYSNMAPGDVDYVCANLKKLIS